MNRLSALFVLSTLFLAACADINTSQTKDAPASAATGTIEQTVSFDDVSPQRLYEIYLSAEEHGAFTGFPAVIDPREGGEFKAFAGVPEPGVYGISGRILQLDAGVHSPDLYVIVQSWRGFHDKPTDPDSTLVLSFRKTETGSSLSLVQTNVPSELIEIVTTSWTERYWQPLRAYLVDHSK